jgi:hypothetical protein
MAEVSQTLLLNNKKSKKVGFKRKDALTIAAQIRQWLSDRGILLPHTSDRLFGRGFKVTESLKTQAHAEVKKRYPDLSTDSDHINLYIAYREKFFKRYKILTAVNFPAAPRAYTFNPDKLFPYSFRRFTQRRYLELKRDQIKKFRREYAEFCEEKALRTFTDRETGEILYDDYSQLARAYYALYQCSPATYAIFKNPNLDTYSSQGITFTCSKHRIDPVWNYVKSKKLRSAVHGWMNEERIHEKYQPMHLVLTVPHPGGVWEGKTFYAREMVEKFNLMRKHPTWNKYIYGGLQCLEITRKGKNGLHIHIHAMVLQRPEFDRNVVADFISKQWEAATGGVKCWYETLYVHKRVNPNDKKSAWICDLDERGNKIWDEERQEYKKRKFYLDERYDWFHNLPDEEKFEQYVTGVLECIKYHFKYESFKTGKKIEGTNVDEWDIELIADVLKHSKNLRMFDKFGKLYGVKRLSMGYIEQQASKEVDQGLQVTVPPTESDGVENLITNPYTGLPAQKGEYIRVLAMPQFLNHYGPQSNYRPIIDSKDHDVYFKIKHDIPIRRVIEAIMKKTWEDILLEAEYQRLRDCNYQWCAPRETLFI